MHPTAVPAVAPRPVERARSTPPRLGLGANWRQFALLVVVNAFVGATVGIERSVLSPGVFVGPNAVIRESVVLTDAYIEAEAVVERCILDKISVIGHRAHVGMASDIGELKITCVGKNSHIPAGFTVGNGCILGTDLRPEDFAAYPDKIVPSNTRVGYSGK